MAIKAVLGVSLRLFDLDTGLVMGNPFAHTIWLSKDVHDINARTRFPTGVSMMEIKDEHLDLPVKIWMIFNDLQQPLQVRLCILFSHHVTCPAFNLVTRLLKVAQHMIIMGHSTLEQLVLHVNQPSADSHEKQECHVDGLNAKQQMVR